MDRIYLDHNAGSLMRKEICEELYALMGKPIANASSVHGEGRASRAVLSSARANVAELVGASPDQVIFTASASEAANLALTPNYLRGKHSIKFAKCFISAIEHPCVLSGGRFAKSDVEFLSVDDQGLIDLNNLAAMLAPFKAEYEALEDKKDPKFQPPFVAVMLANNETGVIEPIHEVAQLVHEAGGFLLVDAVQAAGKIIIDVKSLGADGLLLSAHKLGGPQGAGALVMGNSAYKADPLIKGGGQENHHRAGTENLLAIAGFGKICELVMSEMADETKRIKALRDYLEQELSAIAHENACGLQIFSQDAPRLPNTSCFAVEGLLAETALIQFDLSGIAISSGSACSSGKVKSSHVLNAMGVDENWTSGALRVSLGWNTTKEDVEGFIKAFKLHVERLYKAA